MAVVPYRFPAQQEAFLQPHNGMGHGHGIEIRDPHFHCLLDNPVHLFPFGQSLEQGDAHRWLMALVENFHGLDRHGIASRFRDFRHKSDTVVGRHLYPFPRALQPVYVPVVSW